MLDTRAKQFDTGLRQLEEEGLMQVVYPVLGRREPILCVVGPLQMEVVEARLRQEYGVDCRIESMSVTALRWLRGDPQEIANLTLPSTGVIRATDRDGQPVLLFESSWHLSYSAERNPGVEFVVVG
jgi:peptide chain release factor 3